MLPLPAVWHPAVVHFPIAFLALAGPVALVWAVRGGAVLRWATLALLVLGTVGVVVARQTGETLEHDVEGEPRVERYLDAHEQAADWTLWLGLAATLAVGAAEVQARRTGTTADRGTTATGRGGALALRLAGAALALMTAAAVARTGHLGGLMTWGAAPVPSPAPMPATVPPPPGTAR